MKKIIVLLVIVFGFSLVVFLKINNIVFPKTETTNNTLPSITSVPEVSPLRIYWQGQSYIATKGIYMEENVELLGKTEDNLQIYRRKNQTDLNSLLLKNPHEGYFIYQLENK